MRTADTPDPSLDDDLVDALDIVEDLPVAVVELHDQVAAQFLHIGWRAKSVPVGSAFA